ncbi:MAG: hypothetical protein HAW58_01405 [Candidatus Thioglobus sp.]|nr:hypothetical protein [Candidatus Thioglobus sp.]
MTDQQTITITTPAPTGTAGPATLQAVANGVANQVIVYWAAVANADNYKLYQTTADLSAFAGGTAANLASASPAPTATITVNGTSTVVILTGSEAHNFLVTAVIGGVESLTSPAQTSATANDFVFATVSGGSNTVWIDRNLGAQRVATASNDADAYGGYYQWGRPTDGHQLRNSGPTATKAPSISPGHAQFITQANEVDWTASGVDTDKSQRIAFWGRIDGSGICPTGFRVPTEAEWRAAGAPHNDLAEAFASVLKLPTAGSRETSGAIKGGDGLYWTNSSRTIYFDDFGSADVLTIDGIGASVRCIRDASITITVAAAPVQNVAVTGVEFTSSILTVEVGKTITLTARVLPTNATNQNISWTLTGVGGAGVINNALTVVTDGEVVFTGTGIGLVAVNFAAVEDTNINEGIVINVTPAPVPNVPVASVSITSANTVEVGTDLTLEATVAPSTATNPDLTWAITDDGSTGATLAGNVLSTTAAGEVIVTATADGINSTPQTITVTAPAVSADGPTTLRAVASGAPNQVIIYWSAVADATAYKVYQSDTSLESLAGGSAADLTQTPTEVTETNALVTLTGDYKNQHYFLVTAVVNGEESTANATQVVASANPQSFRTITRGDRVWLDRNLGAAKVAASSTDADSYGHYYQFGRQSDGHQLPNSAVINTSSNTFNPTHGSWFNAGNWLSNAFDDYPALLARWQNTDGSSVCPTGFKVPTPAEFTTEIATWPNGNAADAFSLLKMPLSGRRNINGASFASVGEEGNYSSINETLVFSNGNGSAAMAGQNYATGFTVRCIQAVSVSDTIPVPTIEIAVTGINITSANTAEVGTDLTLTADVVPDFATDHNITWTVDAAGSTGATLAGNVLSTTAAGVVSVRATTANGISATQDITVSPANIPVTNIRFASPPALEVGATFALTATVEPADATDKSITWEVSRGTNITISGNILTAVSVGNSGLRYTANDGSGVTGTRGVNIIAAPVTTIPVASVTITSANTVEAGNDLTLEATVSPNDATDKTITWALVSFSGSANATLSGNILSATTGGGTAVVSATAGGVTVQQTITITAPAPTNIPVASITITSDSFIFDGATLELTADVLPANATNSDITWEIVSGGGAASINGSTLHSIAPGSVGIRARATDSSNVVSDIQNFSVEVRRATSVSIDSPNTVAVGATVNLSATVLPNNATTQSITWAIQGGGVDIASIDTSAVIYGIAAGVVTVVVSVDGHSGGVTDTQQFTVTAPPVSGGTPDAPTALQAVATGSGNQVRISWTASPGASAYKVYHSTGDLAGFQNADNFNAANPPPTEVDVTGGTSTNINLDAAKVRTYFLVTALNAGGDESPTNATQAVAVPHGFRFELVTSPITSREWHDRNLGAASVAQTINPTAASGQRGFYFQWGRWADDHATDGNSFPTRGGRVGEVEFRDRIAALDYSSLSGNNQGYVTGGNQDWTTVDTDGARRSAFWSRTDGSSVCPTGFRVPTSAEWGAEIPGASTIAGAFNSFLKIPTSGLRNDTNGGIKQGNGQHWTS